MSKPLAQLCNRLQISAGLLTSPTSRISSRSRMTEPLAVQNRDLQLADQEVELEKRRFEDEDDLKDDSDEAASLDGSPSGPSSSAHSIHVLPLNYHRTGERMDPPTIPEEESGTVSRTSTVENGVNRTQTGESNASNNSDDLGPPARRTKAFHRESTARKMYRVVTNEKEQLDAFLKKRHFSCKHIIPYDSYLKLVWDILMMLLVLYTVVIIPLEIAFDPVEQEVLLAMDIITTVGFAFNILITFRTSVERTESIVTDPKQIATIYLSKWFWVDLVSTIPWDMILLAIAGGGGSVLQTIARLLRLTRLLRLVSGEKFELTYSKISIRFAKMIAYALCIAHWIGCCWYWLSSSEDFGRTAVANNEPPGFVAPESLENESLSYKYLISFHWGMRMLISMGSELEPTTSKQAFLAIVVVASGVMVFAIIIGNMELLLAQSAASSIRFQEHITSLDNFLRHHRIDKKLKKLILQHTHHLYRTRRGMDEQALLSTLPTEMRNRVYRQIYKAELKKCSFFAECNDDFVAALCAEIKPQVALEGDIIIRQGSIGAEMYIIHSGTADAVDVVTQEVHSTIEEGSFFGEIALFTNSQRTLSVVASTYMELYMLPKDRFLHVLEFFPEEEQRFVEIAKQRVSKTQAIAKAVSKQTNGREQKVWGPAEVTKFFETNGIAHLQPLFDTNDVASFISRFDKRRRARLSAEDTKHIVSYLKAKAERLRAIGHGHQADVLDDDISPYLRSRRVFISPSQSGSSHSIPTTSRQNSIRTSSRQNSMPSTPSSNEHLAFPSRDEITQLTLQLRSLSSHLIRTESAHELAAS